MSVVNVTRIEDLKTDQLYTFQMYSFDACSLGGCEEQLKYYFRDDYFQKVELKNPSTVLCKVLKVRSDKQIPTIDIQVFHKNLGEDGKENYYPVERVYTVRLFYTANWNLLN